MAAFFIVAMLAREVYNDHFLVNERGDLSFFRMF